MSPGYTGNMGASTTHQNRIRDLRIERQLTQEELAARLGEETSIATVSRLESGRMTLTYPWMKKIGEALGVSPQDIISPPGQSFRMVPLLGSISAGSLDFMGQAIEPEAWVPIITSVGGPRAFALRPKGDSMNLVADEDSYVIVDPDQLALEDGRIFAVASGDQATFKRYKSDPPRLEPMSTNPEHKPILVGREPFMVVGRVCYVGRSL